MGIIVTKQAQGIDEALGSLHGDRYHNSNEFHGRILHQYRPLLVLRGRRVFGLRPDRYCHQREAWSTIVIIADVQKSRHPYYRTLYQPKLWSVGVYHELERV